MSLAVAGLKPEEIQQRTSKLASGDWSAFPVAERLAFRLGHQLTREPETVGAKDIKTLVDAFGPVRAVDVVYYICWGNYMTRVADAIQFPLEEGNPFAQPKEKQPKGSEPPGKK